MSLLGDKHTMGEYKLWGPIHKQLKNHKVREEEIKLYRTTQMGRELRSREYLRHLRGMGHCSHGSEGLWVSTGGHC